VARKLGGGSSYEDLGDERPRGGHPRGWLLPRRELAHASRAELGKDVLALLRVDLALRTYTLVLIDAGFPELEVPVPWWGGRTLRFGFPPR
jgi:hypothetical protein